MKPQTSPAPASSSEGDDEPKTGVELIEDVIAMSWTKGFIAGMEDFVAKRGPFPSVHEELEAWKEGVRDAAMRLGPELRRLREGKFTPEELQNLRLPAHEFQAEQWEWVQATFPGETAEGVLKHLREEINELADALLAGDRRAMGDELADIFLLTQCLASHAGVDLMFEARRKFDACKERKWEHIPGRGWRTAKEPTPFPGDLKGPRQHHAGDSTEGMAKDVKIPPAMPEWFLTGMTRAEAEDHANAGDLLARCVICGGLLFQHRPAKFAIAPEKWHHQFYVTKNHEPAPENIFDPIKAEAERFEKERGIVEWKGVKYCLPDVLENLAVLHKDRDHYGALADVRLNEIDKLRDQNAQLSAENDVLVEDQGRIPSSCEFWQNCGYIVVAFLCFGVMALGLMYGYSRIFR